MKSFSGIHTSDFQVAVLFIHRVLKPKNAAQVAAFFVVGLKMGGTKRVRPIAPG
jgi:hypothetical protein